MNFRKKNHFLNTNKKSTFFIQDQLYFKPVFTRLKINNRQICLLNWRFLTNYLVEHFVLIECHLHHIDFPGG